MKIVNCLVFFCLLFRIFGLLFDFSGLIVFKNSENFNIFKFNRPDFDEQENQSYFLVFMKNIRFPMVFNASLHLNKSILSVQISECPTVRAFPFQEKWTLIQFMIYRLNFVFIMAKCRFFLGTYAAKRIQRNRQYFYDPQYWHPYSSNRYANLSLSSDMTMIRHATSSHISIWKTRVFPCKRVTPFIKEVVWHFYWDYYKSSPLWFIVRGTKALIRLSKMNAMVYVVRTTEV
jgi:hypothetical protein